MPPRFAYWTIILDGTATSFRAHEREELVPTFNRLKKRDPAAVLKWFSGGTLWDSPEQAKEQRRAERERQYAESRPGGDRPSRIGASHPRSGPSHPRSGAARPRDWRPASEPETPVRPAAPADTPVFTVAPRKSKTLPRLPSAKPKS